MDFYSEAREIVAHLKDEGLVDQVRVLEDVIDGGATGTEILFGLRWHLQRIDEAGVVTSLEVQQRMRDLYASLNDVLS